MSPKPTGKPTKYGYQHQKLRKQALAQFIKGQLCVRCELPMNDIRLVELDHDDDDPTQTRYKGLSHEHCNRKAGGEKGRARQLSPTRPGPTAHGFWFNGVWNSCSEDW